jgi:hypothetical protein
MDKGRGRGSRRHNACSQSVSVWLAAGLVGVALSGCVTVNHKAMTKESSAQLQAKSVVATRYDRPDFAAMTPAKAAFGLIGAAAMISEGNEIVKVNEIADPAVGISDRLLRIAQERRSIVVAQPKADSIAASDELHSLLATYSGTDYILDVKTINWMFGYYPTNWTGYRVMYSARVRVIETATKDVAAESLCTTVQGDDAKPPTYDQLLADKAALLKSLLDKATTQRVDVIAKELLQLSS